MKYTFKLLKSVIVNDKPIQPRWDKAEQKIFLPMEELKLGEVNEVKITFSNRFTHNGKAFHRSLDHRTQVGLYDLITQVSNNSFSQNP